MKKACHGRPSNADIVKSLLARHGRTYCDEIGIKFADSPSPLFRWLVASLLFSARIGAPQAVKAATALSKAGWRTPEKMIAATWEERVAVLNGNGYARYDESTARMLADTAQKLIEDYGGDLRKLRKAADGSTRKCETLLTAFKGIGPTGAAIFLREAQAVWPEFRPFADPKSVRAGEKLGLGASATALARHVSPDDFPVFLAALVRADLAKETNAINRGEVR